MPFLTASHLPSAAFAFPIRAAVVDVNLVLASTGVCTIILRQQQSPGKMGGFNALLFLVFAFGLMSSASMAKAPSRAQAPIAAVPKTSPIESPAASPPASATAPSEAAAKTPSSASSPTSASARSEAAKTPSSASSPTAQTPASSPSAEGPGTALPPSSGAESTATFEKIMAMFGAALAGGAALLL